MILRRLAGQAAGGPHHAGPRGILAVFTGWARGWLDTDTNRLRMWNKKKGD